MGFLLPATEKCLKLQFRYLFCTTNLWPKSCIFIDPAGRPRVHEVCGSISPASRAAKL